jgi:hypothetical protein
MVVKPNKETFVLSHVSSTVLFNQSGAVVHGPDGVGSIHQGAGFQYRFCLLEVQTKTCRVNSLKDVGIGMIYMYDPIVPTKKELAGRR